MDSQISLENKVYKVQLKFYLPYQIPLLKMDKAHLNKIEKEDVFLSENKYQNWLKY